MTTAFYTPAPSGKPAYCFLPGSCQQRYAVCRGSCGCNWYVVAAPGALNLNPQSCGSYGVICRGNSAYLLLYGSPVDDDAASSGGRILLLRLSKGNRHADRNAARLRCCSCHPESIRLMRGVTITHWRQHQVSRSLPYCTVCICTYLRYYCCQ